VTQSPPSDPSAAQRAYLAGVGARLRRRRAERGMTRRLLARRARVSERYIAQIESGEGNVSILLLRRIAEALATDIGFLLTEREARDLEFVLLEQMLSGLDAEDFAVARRLIAQHFPRLAAPLRTMRVALIGLRGGGKSTLGPLLAARLGARFVELGREIEQEAGASLGEIFDQNGQAGYRRLELRALTRLIASNEALVIATGGSLVTEPATFELLLRHCLTVWVRATPRLHMQRVIAQGDFRPMSELTRAMDDLHAILEARTPLYAKADLTIDTSAETPIESAGRLAAEIIACRTRDAPRMSASLDAII
jgi:XRE family aerobic/anaerobic benzoate catabolism transcriptional regulator